MKNIKQQDSVDLLKCSDSSDHLDSDMKPGSGHAVKKVGRKNTSIGKPCTSGFIARKSFSDAEGKLQLVSLDCDNRTINTEKLWKRAKKRRTTANVKLQTPKN